VCGAIGALTDPQLDLWTLAADGAGDPGQGLVTREGRVLAGASGRPTADDLVVTAPLETAPWRVVVRQPRAVALAAVLAHRRRLLLLGPALIGLGVVFAWGAARSITEPLARLSRAAEGVAGGAMGEPIPVLGDDEVGRLGAALETMRASLARLLDEARSHNEELERRVAERTRELERLYAELAAREAWRGRLLQRAIGAQEDERRRIARELHDETYQSLNAIALRLDTALAAASSAALRTEAARVRGLARDALDAVHRLILDLRPSVLDDLGLVPAIRWYVAHTLEPLGLSVRCELEEPEPRLPAEAETALFRAVQEALTNVVRHASADSVLIQLACVEGQLRVEIEDDGVGFDTAGVAAPAPSGRGLGLMGIRERLELMGGRAEIESSPGCGTRVVLVLSIGVPAHA